MRITLGAGDIAGGTNLQVFNFVTALDCRRFLPLPNVDAVCAPNPDGPRVTFTDAVTTDCPSVLGGTIPWLVTPAPPPPGFPPPNSELFTSPFVPPTPPFTPALQIPANTSPFCTTDLTFKVLTPPTDASCTTGAAPLNCCKGAGTGFCQKSDNLACTDVLNPFPCCTGNQDGFCGFSNSDCTGPLQPVACCVAAGAGFCDVIQSGNDANCTTGPAPFTCCTGAGTGFCEPKDNAACTGFLAPFPCCRPGTGVGNCGDIFQLSEYVLAQCDNHVLESSQTQTAELPVCVVTPTPDFNCYQADTNFSTPLSSLVTMFGTFTNVKADDSQRLCTPAIKVKDATTPAVPQGDPSAHLVAYKIQGSNLKATDGKGVQVHTQQFGDFTVDVKRVSLKAALLVPSSKSLDPNNPPPNDDKKTGHFLCFNIDTKTGSIPSEVLDRDQFNPNPPGSKPPQGVTFTNLDSWRLCVPVNKNGGDPSVDPNAMSADGLLCLVTGTDINSPIKPGVNISYSNQLQPAQKKVHLDKLDDFCVPATITK
jgi:hypothetical protein